MKLWHLSESVLDLIRVTQTISMDVFSAVYSKEQNNRVVFIRHSTNPVLIYCHHLLVTI